MFQVRKHCWIVNYIQSHAIYTNKICKACFPDVNVRERCALEVCELRYFARQSGCVRDTKYRKVWKRCTAGGSGGDRMQGAAK